MLLKANAVMKSRVNANDGDVGKVVDILFDDQRWVARYMVVETGKWLESRRVLVSPASLARVKGEIGVVHANLSREQIRHCPDVDTEQPVSRQYEAAHALHYGHGDYWSGPQLWGRVPSPGLIGAASLPEPPSMPAAPPDETARPLHEAEQSHLRSCKDLIGYRIEASDGDAGDIDDLAIDDESWAIPDLLVDTRRWWPGGQVLIATSAVEAIHHGDRSVKLRLSREATRAGAA
jgi:hypothetical protein